MDATRTQRRHEPVLLEEVLDLLRPRAGGLYCDGTAGRGGHAEALLEASGPDGRLVAIDRDPEAVRAVRERLSAYGTRAVVVQGRFGELAEALAEAGVTDKLDGLLVDLGVSSPQLETAERGFSFQLEGPIDMRLDPSEGVPALELLESLSEEELARVIWELGEERRSRRVAREIKAALRRGELRTTLELAALVRRAVGQARSGRVDAATRTFQALRMRTNDELGQLAALLEALPAQLAEGGRAAFIAFHSLEDRAVKQGLRRLSTCRCAPRIARCGCGGPLLRPLTRKPLRPSEAELERNPRSRSAKLRAAERLASTEAVVRPCP